MKFKIIASLLLLAAILGALYVSGNSSSTSSSKPSTINDGIKF